ncbi:MAG: 23S rRNA (guanosine(2251)-2'-O)-methyltransferase RlmB [Acidimicrobiales bacterium]
MRRQPPGRQGRRASHADPGLGGEQVEGRQAVRELLRSGQRRVHQVSLIGAEGGSGPLRELAALAEAKTIPVRHVGRQAIEEMSRTDSPQGVVALADPVVAVDLEVLARGSDAGGPPFLVVVDGVTDPHNLGAIMRSALCAGATGMVIARHRSAHLTPAAVKAAAGAVEHLPVALVAGIPGALSRLSSAGLWLVGLTAGAAVTIWDLPVGPEPLAVVMGAEGSGLSRLTRQRCDLEAGIPLRGPLGSLNVSAAAAIACFEIARRRSQP